MVKRLMNCDHGLFKAGECENCKAEKTKTTLWIVGKVDKKDFEKWQFQGVFESQRAAVEACENIYYFVGPVDLNRSLPEVSIPWPGAYYPRRFDGEEGA